MTDRPAVAPVPLEDFESPGDTRREHPPGAWVLVAAVVGLGAAMFVLSGGGAPSDSADGARATTTGAVTTVADTAAPTSTTTEQSATAPATVPPTRTLAERVPGLTTPLTLVSIDHDANVEVVRWNPSSPAPSPADARGTLGRSWPMFDADGSSLAWQSVERHETLWIGTPPRVTPIFIDTAGAQWHPERPGDLAWVGRPPAATGYELYRLTVPRLGEDGDTPSLLDDLQHLGPVPFGLRLVGWGDWGFVVSGTPGADGSPTAVTQVRDPEGRVVRSTPGWAHAVSPTGTMVLVAHPESAEVADSPEAAALGLEGDIIPIVPGPNGAQMVVVDLELRPLGVVEPADMFSFAPDGDTVISIGFREGGTVITSTDLAAGIIRRSSIDEPAMIVGFAGNGRYLVLHTWQSPTAGLVFHHWRHAASYRVPYDAPRVLAVTDTGPTP